MVFKTTKKCLLAFNSQYQAIGELIFRLILCSFILTHGLSKLLSFSKKLEFFPDPLGIGSSVSLSLAVFAEFFCAVLLFLGLFTRFAAFNLLATMLTAGLIFHANDPFSKKELALLYAIGFLYFLIAGGNRYSLDQVLRKKYL